MPYAAAALFTRKVAAQEEDWRSNVESQNRIKVLVFCGHRFGNRPSYIHAMHGVGQALAENEMEMVYGGSEEGLMGTAATAAIGHGGVVTGIIPDFLLKIEKPLMALHQPPHQLIVTESMPERKQKMFERADAVVTGPGGPGTRDEFWEKVTNGQVGQCKKPHFILNIDGCFDPLEADFDRMIADGFMDPPLKPPFLYKVEDIVPAIRRALGPTNIVDIQTLKAAG